MHLTKANSAKSRARPIFNQSVLAASILAAGAAFLPSTTIAAENSAAIEEVMVTARKRSETMLDIPISINVVSENAIQNLGAQNYTDLLGSVPSLTAYQNGPGRTRISIRGIANGGGNDNDTQNQETVGIYLDEIPISMGAMNPEFSLFDLERVEVLRGPQGTLYGAGSMTGTIRLVSKKPDMDGVSGMVEGDLATVHKGSLDYSVKGVVNLPVIEDVLAVRASGYFVEKGGYIDNVATGQKDVNNGGSKGGRISALWNASENLTVNASFFAHDYSDNGRPEDLDRAPELSRDYTSFDGYDDEMKIYNLTMDYDLGWGEVVSSTSYFDRTVVNRRSLDDLFKTALPPGIIPHELVDTTDTEVFVQEIRLASTNDDPLQWTIGAYADKKDVYYLNTFPVPGADAIIGAPSSAFGAPTDHLFYGYDDLTVETYAFFGEAYYTIDKLTVTAGLRYFNWQQDISFYQSGLFNGEANSDTRPTGKTDGVNPKLNVSYDLTDDVLVYAQAAKGFRYGGINGAIPQSVCAAELGEVERQGGDTRFFDPDETWNYEIGAKGRAADGRIIFNATIFQIDWTDMQTSRSFECGFGFRENVGQATSQGLELELTAKPSDNLTLNIGGSYTEATLDQDVPNLNAEEGDPAPFVPELSLSGSAEYTQSISDEMEGFVFLNAQYTDDRGTEFSAANANYRKMKGFTTANLRIGVKWEDLEISLYGNNLFDSRGVVRSSRRPPFDPDASIRVQPRTIGFTVRSHF